MEMMDHGRISYNFRQICIQIERLTNRILEEHGMTIHTIPCSELSRGRGGPRCMSMPFVRDDVD